MKSFTKSRRLNTSKPVQQPWDFPVQYLKGVGEKLAELLAKANIRTLWDILLQLPRTYEDRRKFHTFKEISDACASGEVVMGRATILRYVPKFAGPRGRRWVEADAELTDAEGQKRPLMFTWFNDFGGSLQKRFPEATSLIFRGKPQNFRHRIQIVHPELTRTEAVIPEWESGFVPVYRELSGISTRVLRKILAGALENPAFLNLPETLPADLVSRLKLAPLKQSLRELHFPKNWVPREVDSEPEGEFFRRVVFEELFMMALALHFRRAELRLQTQQQADAIPKIKVAPSKMQEWLRTLPFELTSDQQNVLADVCADLSLAREIVPMHRLLQGDVGSGKTIVAFLAGLYAMEAGFQVALMAPTEILADQHFRSFVSLFPERSHEALLLKGALSMKKKKGAREELLAGRARFVIGTQALLTESTVFERLGLVIIDEQHRFGVEQRLGLKQHGGDVRPHLLVMTATPIPRSLALTLYGDLALSSIREKPKGRKPIRTHLLRMRSHDALVGRIQKFTDEGRQIYVVYPLVEESEELDLKDVKTAFVEWQKALPKIRIGLLHGRMKSAEKDSEMRDFRSGEIRVLVATTVIEVGVDVPNASVIVIEHAERFGLSQLHQLRGRVGRGSEESFCILVAGDRLGDVAYERLKIMEASDDGFEIAEKDLNIRGPGEFLGRRQSGLPGFRVAHILRDLRLMEEARDEARQILLADPQLLRQENQSLRHMFQAWWKGHMELTLSG